MNVDQSASINLDPLPSDWLDDSKVYYIQQVISPVESLLRRADLFDSFVSAWIDDQIISEIIDNKNVFEDLNDRLNLFDHQLFSFMDLESLDLISRQQLLIVWSASHWSDKLESMYLRNKAKLDKVSFKMITVSNKNLATEIYHRLKANEESFDALSLQYGEGSERFRGGYYPLQSFESLPDYLRKSIKSCGPGDLLKPFKSSKGSYSVLLINDLSEAAFDDESKKNLLRLQFTEWKSLLLPHVQKFLVEI